MARVRITLNRKACRELPSPGSQAYLPGIRAELRRKAEAGGARARAKLAAHRDTGASTIEVSSGTVDSFVSLDDTRGDQAAGIINNQTGALGSAF